MWPSSWWLVANHCSFACTLISERTSLRVVDVPGGRVAVLLARQAGRHRVEVGALPERRRQLLESERDVEALRALDDVLGRRPLEQRVEAGGLDDPRPALRPAVADPVRGDQLRGRALVARGELVLRPAVQPVVQRLRRRQRVVEQLHHLVDGHAVVGDLEREERVVAQLARHLVAQLDQLDQARLQRPADLLRHRPDALALVEIARLLQDVVDVVGGDRLGAAGALGLQAERVAVEDRRLLGLQLDAPGDDLGNRPGVLGGGEQQLAELADGQVVQLLLVLEQRLGLVDARWSSRSTRASALSAPVRCATCSGVTSVAAAQSASAALVDTGASSPVTVARKASASFWTGPRLAARFPGLGGCPRGPPRRAATATPADRQATRTPRWRIEGRMPRTYLNRDDRATGSADPSIGLRPLDGRGRVVTERPRMNRFRALGLRRRPGVPLALGRRVQAGGGGTLRAEQRLRGRADLRGA